MIIIFFFKERRHCRLWTFIIAEISGCLQRTFVSYPESLSSSTTWEMRDSGSELIWKSEIIEWKKLNNQPSKLSSYVDAWHSTSFPGSDLLGWGDRTLGKRLPRDAWRQIWLVETPPLSANWRQTFSVKENSVHHALFLVTALPNRFQHWIPKWCLSENWISILHILRRNYTILLIINF